MEKLLAEVSDTLQKSIALCMRKYSEKHLWSRERNACSGDILTRIKCQRGRGPWEAIMILKKFPATEDELGLRRHKREKVQVLQKLFRMIKGGLPKTKYQVP